MKSDLETLNGDIEKLISKSKYLLSSPEIDSANIKEFRLACIPVYSALIDMNLNSELNESARAGIEMRHHRPRSLLVRKLSNYLNSKASITFNAPFLSEDSESAYLKRYVFNNKMKLEGIKERIRYLR